MNIKKLHSCHLLASLELVEGMSLRQLQSNGLCALCVKFILSAICFVAIASNCYAQDVKWNNPEEVIFNGNKFNVPAERLKVFDSVIDPVTGKLCKILSERPAPPVNMNGEKIYNLNEVTTPPLNYLPNSSLEEYLLIKILSTPQFASFADGSLSIGLDDIVIDKNGRIVYYVLGSIHYIGADKLVRSIPPDETLIDKLIMSVPPLEPATVNGNKVIVEMDISLAKYKIIIKDHHISYTKYSRLAGN